MWSERLQKTLHKKKIMFKVVLILLEEHCTEKKPYAMLSERLQTTLHEKEML